MIKILQNECFGRENDSFLDKVLNNLWLVLLGGIAVSAAPCVGTCPVAVVIELWLSSLWALCRSKHVLRSPCCWGRCCCTPAISHWWLDCAVMLWCFPLLSFLKGWQQSLDQINKEVLDYIFSLHQKMAWPIPKPKHGPKVWARVCARACWSRAKADVEPLQWWEYVSCWAEPSAGTGIPWDLSQAMLFEVRSGSPRLDVLSACRGHLPS